MAEVSKKLVMGVPLQKIFAAITEFEKYPQFLPEVVSAKTGSTKDPKKIRVDFELEVVKRFQYSLEFNINGTSEVTWRLLESNFFKTNEGVWRLKEKGADQTEVEYGLKVEFGFLVPGFVAKKLTEVSLPKMFDNFEQQARKL